VALTGKGFFAVQSPRGPLYTRNGNFQLAADGKLVTADGYPVLGTGGTALTLNPSRPIQISSDGAVTQDGTVIGQLEIADFTSGALGKQGNNYFRASDPAVQPLPATGTAVQQGGLEASNSGTADSAVRLIGIMRQFEMLQKAMTLGADMSKQAIEQVAKV
jgi:flagellar basal body rod protein FlgG